MVDQNSSLHTLNATVIAHAIMQEAESLNISVIDKLIVEKADSLNISIVKEMILQIDNAEIYKNLIEKIAEKTAEKIKEEFKGAQMLSQKRTLYSNIQGVTDLFVKRKRIFDALSKNFAICQESDIITLVGERGAGKTEMARYWCHDYLSKNRDALVLEFDASSSESLLSEYKRLAENLSIPWISKEKSEYMLNYIAQSLAQLNNRSVLILFDNAPDFDTVKSYMLPLANKPFYLLITSYNTKSFREAEVKRINMASEFTPKEAGEYVKKVCEEYELKINGINVKKKNFNRNPLALLQTIFCMSFKPSKAIRKTFISNRSRHLGSANPIFNSTKLLTDKLSDEAKKILYFCSFIYNKNIPESLLRECNYDLFDKAVKELESFSLLVKYFNGESFFYKIHEVTQETLRDSILTEDERLQCFKMAAQTIKKSFSFVKKDISSYGDNKNIIMHVKRVCMHAKEYIVYDENILFLMKGLALFQEYVLGDYGAALESNESIMLIAKTILTTQSIIKIAAIFKYRARIKNGLANYKGALKDYDKALRIIKNEKESVENKRQIATIYNNRALVKKDIGNYDGALIDCGRALEIREDILGQDAPGVATVLSHRAFIRNFIGKYNEALGDCLRALAIREKVFPNNHPKIASTLNILATIKKSLGCYHEALEFCTIAINIQKENFGDTHPKIATSLNNSAMIKESLYMNSEALEDCDKALEIRENTLGYKHPGVATALKSRAIIKQSQICNYESSIEDCDTALLILSESFSDGLHFEIAMVLDYRGLAYEAIGDCGKALDDYNKALGILEKIPNCRTHHKFGTITNNRGLAKMALGDYKEALKDYNKALKILEKIDESHPHVAIILNNRARAHLALLDFRSSLYDYKKSLTIRLKYFNIEYLQNIKDLGRDVLEKYNLQKNYTAPPDFFNQLLDIRVQHLGGACPTEINILDIIVNIERICLDYSAALKDCDRVLQIRKNCFGPYHPEVAATFNSRANLKVMLRDYASALTDYEDSLKGFRRCFQEEHPYITMVLANRAFVIYMNEKYLKEKIFIFIKEKQTLVKISGLLAGVIVGGIIFFFEPSAAMAAAGIMATGMGSGAGIYCSINAEHYLEWIHRNKIFLAKKEELRSMNLIPTKYISQSQSSSPSSICQISSNSYAFHSSSKAVNPENGSKGKEEIIQKRQVAKMK